MAVPGVPYRPGPDCRVCRFQLVLPVSCFVPSALVDMAEMGLLLGRVVLSNGQRLFSRGPRS